jgi:hypothetical protein
MSRAETDEFLYESASSTASSGSAVSTGVFPYPRAWLEERERTAPPIVPSVALVERTRPVRRTPRKSLIVVLPEGHVVSPEAVTSRMLSAGSDERMDLIVACAGQPRNLASLQRDVSDLQLLVAPAGTSTEDLRELAIGQAPGDIVTLLCGVPIET